MREPSLCMSPDGQARVVWLQDSEDLRHGQRPVVVRLATVSNTGATARAKATSREPMLNLRTAWLDDELAIFALARYKGQWDIARSGWGDRWPASVQTPGSVVAFDLAVDSSGRPAFAYQIRGEREFQIYLQLGPKGQPVEVGAPILSKWNPTIVPAHDGRLWLMWETFHRGLFRIYTRQVFPDGGMGPVLAVPSDERFCLDAACDVDNEGRLWLACRSVEAWGRDHHFLNGDASLLLSCIGTDRVLATYHVPIPADPECVKLPACPTVLCHHDGAVSVFFRWFRNAIHNDWGWDVNQIRLKDSEWSGVRKISTAIGNSAERIQAIEQGDDVLLCYQACTYDGHRDPPYDSRIAFKRIWQSETQGLDPQAEADATRVEIVASSVRSVLPMGKPTAETISLGEQEWRPYWGDLHRHSNRSKCLSENDGTMQDHYRWAIETAGLDFYAITDHYSYINADDWAENLRLADLYNAPNLFAALLGYEWHHEGHANFYFADEQTAARVWRDFAGLRTLPELYNAFDFSDLAGQVSVIRHYHADGLLGSAQRFWSSVNRAYESVAEVVQTRGFSAQSYECLLSNGQRLGAVGASDHSVRPAARDRSLPYVYAAAITGVYAPSLSRESVLEAIRQRRTFATNGKKMAVWLRVGDLFMGDEGRVDAAPAIQVQAHATTEIERVQIIRDGHVIDERHERGASVAFDFADERAEPGEHYYYVKVWQRPDDVHSYAGEAWSSPVWVRIGDGDAKPDGDALGIED